MLPASPMFSMAFRYNVQRALLNGVRGGRRQPLWVQRLRGAEALGAAAAHPEHPMMRETLNECADGYLDLNALTRLLSAIRAGQVRVYEVHTDAPSPLCLNLRRQVEAEMMYDTAIPSAAVTLSKEALLTLAPTEEAVKSASRPARAPRSADELHARLLSEGDLLAGEACAPAEWMDALEIAGRAVYIEPGLWIARENEDEYRLALEENDAAALSRVVRRTARFHGAQTAETLSERYAVDEARAQEALNALCSEGILREFGGAYVHAELYESAQRMTVALNRQRVETQPARAFARMLSQRVRGVGSSAAQLAQALDSLRGCAYPAAAWEGYLLPARVPNYRPQLLDEALARGEAAYRVLPAERSQLPNETRAQAAARPRGAAPSSVRVSIDGSQLPGETAERDGTTERPQLPGETRAQAAARTRDAAPSSARVSIDDSQLLGEATEPNEAAERPRLPGETRAQAAARTRDAAPSSARASIDGSQFPSEATERDGTTERSLLPGETRAQATDRTRDAAPSSARVSIDGSQLPGETAVRDEAAERSQLSGETRAQAAARPCGAASSDARVSIDGSRLLGETVVRDEAAEYPLLSNETRAQAADHPRSADSRNARVSIDGSQLPNETRAQATARPRGAAPSGARVSIDGSRLPGEAAVRDEAAERSQLSGETRAQAAARTRDAAPSSARVSIGGSRLLSEAAVRDEAAERPRLLGETVVRDEAAEYPQLSNETRAQAAARTRGAAPSGARVSIDGSQLLGEATERDEAAERPRLPGETRAQAAVRPCGAASSGARVSIDGSQLPGEAAECPQLPSETRAQAAARPCGAAQSSARVSIDGSRLPGEAAECPQLPSETRAQATARTRGAAPSSARVSIDGSQLLGEATERDEAAERPRLPGETRAQAADHPRSAAPSGARASIDGSRLPGETVVRDEAAEYPQLSNETRAQAAARPRGAAPSSVRVSIDGSQLPGEAAVRDEAAYRVLPAERSQLPSETCAQAAVRPRGAAPSGARISVDGSRLLSEAAVRDEAAERPQLPGETRAQAAARPCGAAPSGARISIDGSQLPGEATERDGTTERSQLPGETRAQAAARTRDAAPSSARVSIDASQLPSEATERDEAAERPQLPGETRAQATARTRDAAPSNARASIDGSQFPSEATERGEAAYRVFPAERPRFGRTADSRSIPAPEIVGVPADPLAASRVRGSAASAFELYAQRRGTAVLDQGGSAHPESGLRDGRTAPGERTRASRAASGERVRVQFDLPDDEGEYEPLPDDLTDMERDVLQTLTARGASFASRLPVNAGDALKSLLARGLVRADSFLPVREMLATESGNVKKTVRRRVRVMDAGRWSRVGALPQTSAEALVERLFDRFGIVCRETAGADWNAVFGVLKHMEYAGKARRGYFVKGLSGAQFMRETDYSTITAQLRQPSGECVWLPAADPMQAWGAYLAHEEGRAFLRVPGAAVALMDGAVVAVSEKQGETLRVFDDPAAPEALRALADAFRRGAIFPTLPRLLIKKYPPTAAAHLEAAGFTREMLDYTLMRRG